MSWSGLPIFLIGLFSFMGAAMGWDWFLNHRKAKRLGELITPVGARIFYGLIGVVGMVFGILILFQIIEVR